MARGSFTKGSRKYAESKKLGYARYYQQIVIMSPFGGWPQEWIDALQRDLELILSDEDGKYDQNIKVVGRRFFGRHTFGTYDYGGSFGEFIYFQLAHHAAFQMVDKVLEEERQITPAWILRLKGVYGRIRNLMRKLRPSLRSRKPAGHTGPREVKVKRIF